MKALCHIRLALTDAADLAAARARELAERLFVRRGARTAEPAFLRFQSMAGPLLVYTIRYSEGEGRGTAPVRVMEVDGAFQSATYVEDGREFDLPFAYLRAYDCLYAARDAAGAAAPCGRLLMLGGGGFSYPKHVVAHHAESSIHVVELDPAVVAIARRYFFLDRCEAEFETEGSGRLRITEGDAVAFLREAAQPPFDCILNDLFSGRKPIAALADEAGARLIKANLAPGGLYLTNVITALEGPGAARLHRLAETFARVFEHVYVLPVGAWAQDDRDNNLLIASDTAYHIPGAREL